MYHFSDSSSIRMALLTNACFSSTCGLLMILFPSLIGQLIGIDAPLTLTIIGTGLILFALDLAHQATRKKITIWRAIYACCADFLWVILTLIILTAFPDLFSNKGIFIVITVGVIVFALASWQVSGLRKLSRD